MSLCINPRCFRPDHPGNADSRFCESCGSDLLLLGKYRVMRLLSDSSGFGMVYEAYEGTLPKILKVLKIQHCDNPKAIDLFRQEAEILGRFSYPGIPHVGPEGCFQFFARGHAEPIYCFVMEKIDGPNLAQWMQQQGNQPISQRQAIHWLRQLTEILHLVHQHNYFHRDIKPQNIMMRMSGELVLVDFGTAREMTYTYLVKAGQSAGVTQISSPGYTPPEQEHGQAVPQSDFYALGRTFVYLLTGKQLTDQSVYDPMTDEFHWREHAPHISTPLADFIDHLIAHRVVDRPHDTQEILAQLDRIEAGLPPTKPPRRDKVRRKPIVRQTAPPPTMVQVKRRWWLTGAVIITLAVGGIVLYYGTQWFPETTHYIAPTKQTLAGHASYVNALVFSPDGSLLASGSADKTIKLWNVATGKAVQALRGHTSFVNALAISHDGQMLVSGSADRTIKIWNLSTGKAVRTLVGHQGFVNALVITPGGNTIISGGADRTIKVWDPTTGKAIRTLTGHTGFINALAVTPDGLTLISGSADRTLRIWDLATGQQIHVLTGHQDYVNDLVVTPDGRTVISASADRSIKLWDITTGQLLQTLIPENTTGLINALALSPDGKTLASGGSDKAIRFWDLNSGKVTRIFTEYPHHIDYFTINPDWSIIATGSGDRIITLLRL